MFKKYLIRIAGALCILGAVAVMFIPGWIQIDGIGRKDLRNVRSDVDGMVEKITEAYTTQLEYDEDFKDELKDYDLPASRSKIKSRFGEIQDLTTSMLDGTVSMLDLLNASLAAPGIIKDANNMLESELCSTIYFTNAAEFAVFESSDATPDDYDSEERYEVITDVAGQLEDMTVETLDMASEFSMLFVLLAAVLILILLLAVASAVTHVCNKCRWLKYPFLVFLVILVVGSCVAAPMASDMVVDMMDPASPLTDMTLGVTAAPFFAVALMIVPIVLDIIFERKKEKTLVEG